MPASNYCLIDPKGGPIKIQLTVNNGIRSNSSFVLWELQDEKWIKKEKWNLVTGDKGFDECIIPQKPDELENNSLAWSVNSCAMIKNLERGEFTIRIIQDTIQRWKKTASRIVPFVGDGKQLQFGNHIIFKHLIDSQNPTTNLWKQIDS